MYICLFTISNSNIIESLKNISSPLGHNVLWNYNKLVNQDRCDTMKVIFSEMIIGVPLKSYTVAPSYSLNL